MYKEEFAIKTDNLIWKIILILSVWLNYSILCSNLFTFTVHNLNSDFRLQLQFAFALNVASNNVGTCGLYKVTGDILKQFWGHRNSLSLPLAPRFHVQIQSELCGKRGSLLC
jgi:hypothetical protein